MRHEENMSVFPVRHYSTKNTQMVFVSLKVTMVLLFNQMMKDKLCDIGETADRKFYRTWRNVEGECLTQTFHFLFSKETN